MRTIVSTYNNLYWHVRYAWRDYPYHIKMWYQRHTRGWANCDAWRMPMALDKTILAMLDYNSGKYDGYPPEFESFEAWMEVVDFVHVALRKAVWAESNSYDYDALPFDDELAIWQDAEIAHELLGKYWYGFGA